MTGTTTELNAILAERGDSYGEYAVQAALAQRLKDVIASQFGHRHLPAIQRESLDMFCTKISRIVCGDPNHVDSWQDIAGYAELIVKHIKKDRGRAHTSSSFGRAPAPVGAPPEVGPVPVGAPPEVGPWGRAPK